mmetsp:Transcript_7555/g.21422  ORF Transcript_7555/g.21422 Transcript_7555/m.21422 type:complete len:211 (-) Transcript_7555:260-892(-)
MPSFSTARASAATTPTAARTRTRPSCAMLLALLPAAQQRSAAPASSSALTVEATTMGPLCLRHTAALTTGRGITAVTAPAARQRIAWKAALTSPFLPRMHLSAPVRAAAPTSPSAPMPAPTILRTRYLRRFMTASVAAAARPAARCTPPTSLLRVPPRPAPQSNARRALPPALMPVPTTAAQMSRQSTTRWWMHRLWYRSLLPGECQLAG